MLSKGLNFAHTPKSIPIRQIISEIEMAIYKCSDNEKSEIRHDVTKLLKNAKPPKSNLTKEEKKALRELSSDKDIVILKADKGNSTVVMDRSSYTEALYISYTEALWTSQKFISRMYH